MLKLPRLKIQFLTLAVLSLLLGACVTINVYFPAAAAERAADTLIREVWQQPESEQAPQTSGEKSSTPPEKPAPQSHLPTTPTVAIRLLDWMVTEAQAADVYFSVSTPKIQRIKNSMAQRFKTLRPYFSKGALGLTHDGLLSIRKPNAIPLRDRNRIKKAVTADNQDRMALYQAIANANKHPEWIVQIQDTFSQRWISNAQRGWWYQNNLGQWRQK